MSGAAGRTTGASRVTRHRRAPVSRVDAPRSRRACARNTRPSPATGGRDDSDRSARATRRRRRERRPPPGRAERSGDVGAGGVDGGAWHRRGRQVRGPGGREHERRRLAGLDLRVRRPRAPSRPDRPSGVRPAAAAAARREPSPANSARTANAAERRRRCRATSRRYNTVRRYSPSPRFDETPTRWPSSFISISTPSTRCSTARAGSTSCSTQAARLEDAGARGHRARQPVLVGRLPRQGAARRASSRSSAARSTSRPAAGSTQERARRARATTTSSCWPRRREGFRNLIKLVSAGYTEGFYYRPRIDKELLAQHAQGPDRAQQLPEGRDRRAHLRAEQDGSARSRRPRRTATSSAPGNFFLEMQYQGIEEQRIVNDGLLPRRARRSTCRSSAPTTCTTCTARTSRPHDILLCIGTGKTVQRRRADALPRRPVLPEDARGDGGGLRRRARTRWRNTVRIAERCNVDLGDDGEPAAELRRAGRLHARRATSSTMVREGFDRAAAAARGARRPRARCATRSTSTRRALAVRDRRHQADEVPGYFLIVWDFIRYAREQGIPVGPGRGSAAGSLVAYCLQHHRRRPAALRPALRALPEPRARLAARHRHRLLRAAPRRGHRVRHAEVRPRERRADHHLRHDEGEGRRARRRPRARHAVRRRRQGREADPGRARHDARQGARREPGAQGHGDRPTRGSRSCSSVARRLEGMARHASVHAAGVVIAPRPITEFAPLYKGSPRRNHDPVEHEGDRADRPPEDGLPRA